MRPQNQRTMSNTSRQLTDKVRNKKEHILLLELGEVLQTRRTRLSMPELFAGTQSLTNACLGPSTESFLVRPERDGTDVGRDLRLFMISFSQPSFCGVVAYLLANSIRRPQMPLLRSRRQLPSPVDVRRALGFSSSSSTRLPRSLGHSKLSDNLRTQQLSSSAAAPPEDDSPAFEVAAEEKVKRRTTKSVAKALSKNDVEITGSGVLQNNVHEILWQPNDPSPSAPLPSGEDPNDCGLPEPWLLQDAYEILLLALHPQTQHRATYPSSIGLAVEPTLGFYCPIEGGDYVIDSTIRSLARRAKADVVVVDALELSAGEHGRYGKCKSF
jgi:hypothetical protein